MKVAIVGSGNVATVLGKLIHHAGHQIVQVISRNEGHAKTLAEQLNCDWSSLHNPADNSADLYLLAITDTALYHLDQHLQLKNKLVVHTAGSVSKDVLKNVSLRYGIVYPLQSIIKDSEKIPELPLLIDGSNNETINLIQEFANTISDNVTIADDHERLKYHVAAVLVSNFTNHMYAVADYFCNEEQISFDKLLPLIDETTSRIKNHSPQSVQTGPAIREDIYTLGKHLQILSTHPDIKYLYLKLSEGILKLHQKR